MSPADEAGERRGLLPRFTLKDGNTFLLADALGDVQSDDDGLFTDDTRMLSRFELTVADEMQQDMTTPQEEITLLINQQQEAWNRADAAGYARDCDEHMSFTNIVGKMFFGRQVFEERHVFLFTGIFQGSVLDMVIERIHFPRPEFAIVDITCCLRGYKALPPGVSPQADGALHTCLLEVFQRSESGWSVVAYHNVDRK